MKVINYVDEEAKVFGSPAKDTVGRVVVGKADGASFCMRIFELTPGGYTPCHSHPWEHQQFIHAGRGSVLRESQWVEFGPGDVLYIPPNEEHQLKNTGEELLVLL